MRKYFIIGAILSMSSLSAQQASPVRVATVQERSVFEQQRVTGSLRAALSSDISSLEEGRLDELLVREGERVEKGQLLARLDDRRIRQSILSKQAELAENSAILKRYGNELLILREEYDSLIEAEVDYAGSVSKQEKRKARLLVVTTEGDLAVEKARTKTLAASLETLQISLRDMEIKAPFTGVIVERFVEQGSWLGVGSSLLKLRSTDQLEAWLPVPESLPFTNLKIDNINLSASGKKLKIEKLRFIPQVDQRSRNYQVIINIAKDEALIHGMSVEAILPKTSKAKHKLVPSDAISRNGAGYYIYLATPGKKGHLAVPIPVKLLFRLGQESAISNPDLAVGSSVIIEGNERLFPMTPVQVIKEP
ncbi:efflux RND transporter periplasmic adaptor subunit [Lentisphaera profundi]|uniref:Efflux RND transporter periplasmic adaptor subunit n=1 Tax=Lentisphaera profundi TaxID=1658616 RepID=A0ABY7VY77_9BACT|nr:efflux RND transporter periplasmic adaptor subunit [Lentisphaera profundi]WDE98749.1 efflux RND transporter periplasmic adaptor subunit [Lentisphaera profundi]